MLPEPITVTVTTTINQCSVDTASVSPPISSGNSEQTGKTFSSSGRPNVPHAPDSSSTSGVSQQIGSGAGSIGATGRMSETGSNTAISSGASTTSNFPIPSTSSNIPSPSSAPPKPATSSATAPPADFPIILELKTGVQIKMTDGSIRPKASALAAGGIVKGAKNVELDAIKDQKKDIKFDLYTQRYEGSFIAKCRIYFIGAMTRSANFILNPQAITSLTDGSVRLDCKDDDFAPGPPFLITLDIGESIEVTFTRPKMFNGGTFQERQLVFGGLQAPDRRFVEFNVVVIHADRWRYEHKCEILLTSDADPDGYAPFTLKKKPYGQARRAKAWFDYLQLDYKYLQMQCTPTNPDW